MYYYLKYYKEVTYLYKFGCHNLFWNSPFSDIPSLSFKRVADEIIPLFPCDVSERASAYIYAYFYCYCYTF